jgi:Tfp pilus assembly protein PilO
MNRILPICALLIAIAIFFGYVQPTWNGAIAETKAAIAADDQALEAAKAYSAQQNALASDRNKIKATDIAQLIAFLPDSVDNVGLILDLNALAARSGLSLSNIDVRTNTGSTASSGATASAAMDPISSVDLSLSAVGTYASLENFLTGIEKSQRILDVRDIVVKGSETGVYSYDIILRLYWLR